eukprot:TRINITY_DN3001_c0_g1_i2.p1 TRINITY_DN3001_c0_g1~~TRINITY_DN3001_c0_g1_i2.p1  ORF type:complete len:351 (-),score=56.27 TRINITY_DN3001_c0_g1_i2:47-1099(-)
MAFKNATQVFEETIAINLQQFYLNFLEEDVLHFLEQLHKSLGHQNITISPWSLSPQKCCLMRDIRYMMKIKSPFGQKSTTRVTQLQRVRSADPNSIVIENSTHFSDTSIESRLYVSSMNPPDSCVQFLAQIEIPSFFKGIFQRSDIELTKEYLQGWLSVINSFRTQELKLSPRPGPTPLPSGQCGSTHSPDSDSFEADTSYTEPDIDIDIDTAIDPDTLAGRGGSQSGSPYLGRNLSHLPRGSEPLARSSRSVGPSSQQTTAGSIAFEAAKIVTNDFEQILKRQAAFQKKLVLIFLVMISVAVLLLWCGELDQRLRNAEEEYDFAVSRHKEICWKVWSVSSALLGNLTPK